MHRILSILFFAILIGGCTPELVIGEDTTLDDVGWDTGADEEDSAQYPPDATEQDIWEDADAESPIPDAVSDADTDEPEPDPEWSCGDFNCEQAEGTTSLGTMTSLDSCNFELALQAPLSEGQAR